VGDVASGVGFRPFWLMLPGPGPQQLKGIFDLCFYWKLSYNPSLLSPGLFSCISGWFLAVNF